MPFKGLYLELKSQSHIEQFSGTFGVRNQPWATALANRTHLPGIFNGGPEVGMKERVNLLVTA